MAYSSVRVQFEVGHEASLRNKRTPEGFTHDWEVFVRGADNTDIQCFVEKVVFHLHETFLKPRRVVKDPPYSVKESGYAGFVLFIDVYLKNREEPKKIRFEYDLTLQNSGPPISRVLREPRVFQNPSEDFRRKLILGGGVGVDSPPETLPDDKHHQPTKSKPDLPVVKKLKPELPLSNSFTDLFGTPIRRITPEPKKALEPLKKTQESVDKKKSNKHLGKDERDTNKEKEKYVEKEKTKERDKSKEKSSKRPVTPPPVVKTSEDHRKHESKEKKKDETKRKEEKEKKEKQKEVKYVEKPSSEKKEKKEIVKEVESVKKPTTIVKPLDIPVVNERHTNDVEKDKPIKEKHKHRHKKKEKDKNKDKEKHKREKEKEGKDKEKIKLSVKRKHEDVKEKMAVKRKSLSPSPVVRKGPLNTLLDELGSSDSLSPVSDDDDPVPSFKPPVKPVPETKPVASIPKPKSTNLKSQEKKVNEELKRKTEKSPVKKAKRDIEKKRSPSPEKEDEMKLKREEKQRLEKEKKERLEAEKLKAEKKEREMTKKRKREKGEEKVRKESPAREVVTSQDEGTQHGEVETPRSREKFTKEYVAQLRDLQHRIMALEDNTELQQVVQVIADSGQYEITKKTFDFDLCALDNATVRRLQEFFSST